MKKILFVVCSHGNELAGHKLFQDYPYGQTDKVEWEVIIGNPEAVTLNTPFVESDLCTSYGAKIPQTYEEIRASILKHRFKQYDEIYDIRSSQTICPSSWDDAMSVPEITPEIAGLTAYIAAPYITTHDTNLDQIKKISAHHPRAITLYYQKSYDVYADYERILSDFERIVHREAIPHDQKTLLEDVRAVTQDEKKKYSFEFEDFRQIGNTEKKELGLSVKEKYVPMSVQNTGIGTYCTIHRVVKKF